MSFHKRSMRDRVIAYSGADDYANMGNMVNMDSMDPTFGDNMESMFSK